MNADHHLMLHLGIIKKCLCIHRRRNHLWIMKKYNVKQSWEKRESFDCKIQFRYVKCLRELDNDNPYELSIRNDVWFFGNHTFIGAPIVVQSLVSPHLHPCNE